MNNLPLLQLRRLSVCCTVFAILPMATQLPISVAISLFLILLLSVMLRKAPHTLITISLTFILLLLLVLEYKGRFGRDVAGSLLALMLAMKCLEIKNTRDLRALLGFSLFLPFAALLSDQSALRLSLALVSIIIWTGLLSIAAQNATELTPSRLRQHVRMALQHCAIALPLALCLFFLFPRISSPLWGLPNLSQQGVGLGDSMKPSQWLDTLSDDRIAFRVTFFGPSPTPEQRYWRGPVLWDFDGQTWSRTETDKTRRAQPASSLANTNTIRYQISLEPTERYYLPTLDWPIDAPTESSLSAEYTAYANQPVQKLYNYTAQSNTQASLYSALDLASRQRALQYPHALNKKTQALAQQWRLESKTDRVYIQRVLQYIRSDFSYTLATDEPGINAIDDFLFRDKKGFCQHFSSAFALLMRAAGIPSRIVTGYAGGYKNPYGNYWVLYQKDAHAWNEVWLKDAGWIRIDPTAAVASENILDTFTNNSGLESYFGARSAFSPLLDYGDYLKSQWNNWVLGFNATRQQQLLQSIGIIQTQQWHLLLILLLVCIVCIGLIFSCLTRAKKIQQHRIQTAWLMLLHTLKKSGHAKRCAQTALEFSHSVVLDVTVKSQLEVISARYTQWRYANILWSDADIDQLHRDIGCLQKTIKRNRH